jgi:exportin-2 (importin alpha re-exporter)
MNSLRLICKIFYSLSYQDIPEFFEDHMSEFSNLFLRYLTYENELLATPSLDEAGALEKVRSAICQIVHLYIDRYPDEFSMTPQFMQAVWMLLIRTGLEVKYDKLASTAIAVLTAVVKQSRHRELFQNRETLQSICEKIVIPNMTFRRKYTKKKTRSPTHGESTYPACLYSTRGFESSILIRPTYDAFSIESDEELFEDNPIDYIRRDMEGSDIGTRRRAASDLVKGLCEHFQQEVTPLMMSYIGEMLKVSG